MEMQAVSMHIVYDMITLYTYIGEEIPDVDTLFLLITALRTLGWVTMDDIQDHWGDVRAELRKKEQGVEIEHSLVNKLSEARYNYGSWSRESKDVLGRRTEKPIRSLVHLFLYVFAIVVSLIVLVPVLVLIFHYDLVHYEEQLWSECFVWLGFFSLGKYSVCVRSVLT